MTIQAILASAFYNSNIEVGDTAADFTIEWWQKVENSNNNARPWSVGLYPIQQLAISYEGLLADYFWINDQPINNTAQNHLGQGWRHMAYVRFNSVIRGYINGVQYTPNISNSQLIIRTNIPLYVGTGEIAAGNYQGYITDLHIIKGVAKYTGNFTAPTSYLNSGQTGSVFLLPAKGDGSAIDIVGNKNPTSVGTYTTSADVPFASLGPYTQSSNSWGGGGGSWVIDFSGGNYNADLLNVKAGWIVFDTSVLRGIVTGDAIEIVEGTVRIIVDFDPGGANTWTFSQPVLTSYYFDGSTYLNYGASVDWAMDVL